MRVLQVVVSVLCLLGVALVAFAAVVAATNEQDSSWSSSGAYGMLVPAGLLAVTGIAFAVFGIRGHRK